MINHEFSRAEEMLERLGDQPVVLEDTSLYLLEGIDNLCRPLDSAVRRDLQQDTWIRFENHSRQGLWSAYKALGEHSEAIRIAAGLGYPKLSPAQSRGDLTSMAICSGHAQYTANKLSTSYDEYNAYIQAPQVVMMAMAAVRAVVAWKPESQSFGSSREAHYERSLRHGLLAIDRQLWADF